jgi:transposase
VDRAQAEEIYDAGREACVEVLLQLSAAVARLEERVRKLEDEARRDSRTSSRPPSQDPPKTRQQRREEARAKAKELLARGAAARKAGAQDGHPGTGRRLAGEDLVDEIVEHYPPTCRGCGHEFSEDQQRPAGRFGRHQVCELPPISVLLVEHRTRRLRCNCGVKTTATLPAGIAASAFGPRLRAALVTLTARHRISRRGASELAGELFGAPISVGSVDVICQNAGAALADPYQDIRAFIGAQAALHVDETGWRTAGQGRALWGLNTPDASVFLIAEHCNREQFDTLIGDYSGIIVSDRWPGYEHLDPERRQVCWSHLKRDFARHSQEGLADQKAFGEQGLQLTGRVFGAWRAYQRDHRDRVRLLIELAPIQHELNTLLEHAGRNSKRTKYHRRFAKNLLKVWPALWTFATDPAVQPTNNPAERALRTPVIHRKLSHGTRSDDGERFAERALSIAATCRQQHRSLFDYLAEALTAHGRGDPLPALV